MIILKISIEKVVKAFFRGFTVFTALLLIACVSPRHFNTAQLEEYQIPNEKLPTVSLRVFYKAKPAQKICVDNQAGGQNCFMSQDTTRQLIIDELQSLNAFEKVAPRLSASSVRYTENTPQFVLSIGYKRTKLDSNKEQLGKLLLQTMTAFFVPLNRRIRHEMEVNLTNSNNVIFSTVLTRETEELSSWYNADSYQQAAVQSMLKELVMQLHSTKI